MGKRVASGPPQSYAPQIFSASQFGSLFGMALGMVVNPDNACANFAVDSAIYAVFAAIVAAANDNHADVMELAA